MVSASVDTLPIESTRVLGRPLSTKPPLAARPGILPYPPAERAIDGATLRRALEEQYGADELARMVLYDPLTGLPSRVLFRDRLAQTLAQADRYEHVAALLVLDLEPIHGKPRVWSREIHSQFLQAVVQRLKRRVRLSDTVARTGENEFSVILPHAGRGENAAVVARKLLAALGTCYVVGGHELMVAAHIGIGLYPGDAATPETLVEYTGAAMRYARAQAPNSYQFYKHLGVL